MYRWWMDGWMDGCEIAPTIANTWCGFSKELLFEWINHHEDCDRCPNYSFRLVIMTTFSDRYSLTRHPLSTPENCYCDDTTTNESLR
jgi:hypothetical protein